MRNKFIYLGILFILFFVLTINAANKRTKLYMYGVVTSFNDSTIYFTDIMEIDSVWSTNSCRKTNSILQTATVTAASGLSFTTAEASLFRSSATIFQTTAQSATSGHCPILLSAAVSI